MKCALPTDDGKTVSKVFGRAKNFAIYDNDGSITVIVANEGVASEQGAGTTAAAFLADMGVAIVLAPEVGPKAAGALAAAGISIESAAAGMALGDAVAGIRAKSI
jgi:predicted Fe-Mo cluster-binding NifX family protein